MAIRIGIDTGGTFTDVVALDDVTGRLVSCKTPSTPANPADGFITGLHQVLTLVGAGPQDLASISHGTTVATNQLLQGQVGRLGFITTEGYRFLLEIGRQSVPDGYGNSYFWVKPDRIVPADRVLTVGGRLDPRGNQVRPFDQTRAVEVARWFRDQDVNMIGVCFLHSYANPQHEQAMLEVLGREHPQAVVSLSSQVLREYREYERAMTTLVDVAVKPTVARYVAGIAERLHQLRPDGLPFAVMRSNGGALSATEVVNQPISTVLSGPAAGALGAGMVAHRAGFAKVLTCDGGGTSTDVSVLLDGEPTLTTEGTVGDFPSKIPMIDVVTVGAGGGSIAWVSPEGQLKVGPRSAGADPGPLCYRRGGTEPTVTDAHLVLGRIPPHLLGGQIPLDVEAARAGLQALADRLRLGVTECAAGILEVSAWNQANALRQVTVKRGLDVRDFTLVTFGGSGSLLACRLADLLGLAGVLVPVDPGNLSAFGLLTVDVRCDYVRTAVARHDGLDLASVGSIYAELQQQAADSLAAEGFGADRQRFVRTADLRYFGQAFEVRVPVPGGPGELPAFDQGLAEVVVQAFHDEHERQYGYHFRGDPSQPVEWVNLRVTGIGPIRRPELLRLPTGDPNPERARTTTRSVVFESQVAGEPGAGPGQGPEPEQGRGPGPVNAGVYWRADLSPRALVLGPAIIEEYGSTVPIHPGYQAEVDPFGNLVITRSDPTTAPAPVERSVLGRTAGRFAPEVTAQGVVTGEVTAQGLAVLVEIVAGTLASVEREVETAIGRTARSPMIRDAHDFRVGIHDRRLRKLTGRSYSALVHPIVRDFPLESMRPGDVYFHNDVYLSEGGIGHLPDLCVTVPVFHTEPGGEPEVVAFVQAFGHHDDIGGMVPGSMPSTARSVFEEGLMVPPIKLWDAGVPNRAALRILTRNSRMPDSLAADLDAECSAALMGSRRIAELFTRYGRAAVEACFDAILDKTTTTYQREILSRIPDGEYVWEDYAEHDGVDEPRLHTQRITLTKHADGGPGDGPRIVIDFNGTGPQAKGPINHCGDYADGNFLKKWLAPILRNLAESPERMAELDVNEGVVPLIEMRFPPPGTLLTPVFPAPTNARTFVILRLLGVLAGVLAKATRGRMPADQETIRYTGVYGDDLDGRPYLMREVLGGGSGGRWYADGEDTIHVVPDSRNLPTEFTESRFPFRVEQLALAVDSGGPGQFRGGLGYEKHVLMLRDAHFMSIADRSILSCWGVRGGRAGRPFEVTIDPGGPREREVDALADAEPVRAGEVIRIRTTGGGGWGDPLERDPAAVLRDLHWGKVSGDGARADYGVLVRPVGSGAVARFELDDAGTAALRDRLRAERPAERPFFDRGPGYPRLAGGRTSADCDWL